MSRKAQPEVSPISIGFTVLIALFDAILLLIAPVNSWSLILAMWGVGSIIGIAINFYAANTIRKVSKLNPFVLILLSIVFQVVMMSAGIFIATTAKGMKVMSCSDSCSRTSFGEELWYIFQSFQLFFSGAYVGFLSGGIKKKHSKKQPTRRKAA